MSIIVAILLFVVGLGLVIYFAEKLVEGTVATSLGFGLSTFLISVIFLGFDPENLAAGAVGSFEEVAGIALGSVIGAAMVAIGLAFGITALVAPLEFEQAPKKVLTVPPLAIVLFAGLSLDGRLSRLDGIILLLGFVVAILVLIYWSRQGLDIQPTGEVAETIEAEAEPNRWKSLGLLLLSLVGIIAGSEMLVRGSETIIARLGLSEALFGMTILALLVSIEELARELPAALQGRSEISYGNVAGSVLAFFLFNAGIIALVRPVPVGSDVLRFYLPLCFVTLLVGTFFLWRKRVPRWGGAVLIGLYVVFFAAGYLAADLIDVLG